MIRMLPARPQKYFKTLRLAGLIIAATSAGNLANAQNSNATPSTQRQIDELAQSLKAVQAQLQAPARTRTASGKDCAAPRSGRGGRSTGAKPGAARFGSQPTGIRSHAARRQRADLVGAALGLEPNTAAAPRACSGDDFAARRLEAVGLR
jgi:hypothetical protein